MMRHERHTGQVHTLEKAAQEFSQTTGIEPELCAISAGWANDMAAATLNDPPKKLTEKYFGSLMEETGDRLVVLPRDADNIPLFRTRYAAQEIYYQLIEHKYPDARTQIEKSPLEITVHYDRLHEVTQALIGLQRNNEHPYSLPTAEVPNRSENMPPEHILPRGSEQHAQFLWHVCYWMGGGIESNLAFKYLGQMYTDFPELFNPRYIVEQGITEDQIKEVVSQYPALNFNLERIKTFWIANAYKMVSEYEGDVRAVFKGAQSYRTILHRLVNKGGRGFLGFQEKMASMNTHFLEDAGILTEPIPFPPPVDFHLLRLATSLGVLTFDNTKDGNIFQDKTIAVLRKAFYDYIITTGTSELELDDAWWRYSKLMCALAPGNAANVDRSAGRGEKSARGEVDFSNPVILRRYAQSCGRCALNASCTLSVASGEYYADDKIIPVPRKSLADDEQAIISITDDMLAHPLGSSGSKPRSSTAKTHGDPLF